MAPKPKEKPKAAASPSHPPAPIEDLFTTLNRHIQRSEFTKAVKVANQVLSPAPGDEDAILCKVVALIKADKFRRLSQQFNLLRRFLLISVSKRWAIVKDKEVAAKMIKFIELSSIGVSKEAQLRAAKVLEVISDDCQDAGPDKEENFFEYGHRLMADRWEKLRELVKRNGVFTLPKYSRLLQLHRQIH